MYKKIKSEWKTYPKRLRSMNRYTGRVYEYLVDT